MKVELPLRFSVDVVRQAFVFNSHHGHYIDILKNNFTPDNPFFYMFYSIINLLTETDC